MQRIFLLKKKKPTAVSDLSSEDTMKPEYSVQQNMSCSARDHG